MDVVRCVYHNFRLIDWSISDDIELSFRGILLTLQSLVIIWYNSHFLPK